MAAKHLAGAERIPGLASADYPHSASPGVQPDGSSDARTLSEPLRVLLAGDREDDALLLLTELRRGGLETIHHRVDTERAFLSALERGPWDVVLSDFSMPQLEGLAACDLLRRSGLDIPFIFVSGRVGEDRAVEAMRRGAVDCIFKDNLTRLVPAIQREMREVQVRREQARAEDVHWAREGRFRALIECVRDYAIYMLDPNGTVVTWNSGAERIMGYAAAEVIGQHFSRFYPPQHRASGMPEQDLQLAAESGTLEHEAWRVRKNGTTFWASGVLSRLANGKQILGFTNIVRDLTERRHSEVLLRSVLDNTLDAIVSIDDRGIILSFNGTGERLFGYSAQEAVGQNVNILMPDPPKRDHDRFIADYARTGKAKVIGGSREVMGRRKDGTAFPLSLSITEFQLDGKRHFTGILSDITERKRVEEELRASQRLLQTVFDTIPHHLIVKDRESRYLMVNKAWCEAFGRTPEEVLHRPTSEQSSRPPEEVARILEEDRRVFSGESVLTPMQGTLTVKSGEKRYFKGIKVPLRGEIGATAGLIGISMDITSEVEAQQQADIAHARLFDAIESLPAAFYMYDSEHRLLLWNSRCGDFYPEMSRQLRKGMSIEEVLHVAANSDILEVEERVEEWISRRLDQFLNHPGTFEQRLKDGRWIQGIDRRTSDGGTVSLRFDVTETKHREEVLRQSAKLEAIGSLAGGIAHDFNNLLTVIASYADFILVSSEATDALRRDARVIQETSDRAAALTRQLLAFSRRQVLQMRVLDLNKTIGSVERMLRRLIGENIELRTSLHPDLRWIRSDETQIEQIILNLAVNARDAMPKGGKLLIETSNQPLDTSYATTHMEVMPGDYVMLAVTDTGHGMTPEVQKRIFEPFFTTKPPGEGTGMGLATVYGIVTQMQGFIFVYSEPGQGTSFKIYFPQTAEHEPAAASPVEPAPVMTGTESVLLVEDEELVLRSASRILQSAGYRVLEVSDPREALKICGNSPEPIDLLLSDVVMPGISGRELWDQVRAMRPLRVLFMSGYTDDAVVRHGILEGNVPFLTKPFTRQSLLSKVRDVLDTPRPDAQAVS